MVTLYYGSGNCTIEGANNIKGVQIFYKGRIEIEDATPNGYEIVANGRQIIIFSINSSLPLNDLFTYNGTFQIKSVIIADENAEKVSVSIKKVMDYSELINTNAEDMTISSEDLKATYTHGDAPLKTSVNVKNINNLHTSNLGSSLFYEDGIEYTGYFHIHKKDQTCMTGAEHDDNSKELYFYQGDKLLPTKNTDSIPYATKGRKITSRKIATTKIKSTNSTKRVSSNETKGYSKSSGGGY